MTNLRPINILLTAAGCPGASTCISYLRNIKERKVRVIAVDAHTESIGRFFSDEFVQVPLANDPGYVSALLDAAVLYNADCVVVVSSSEVEYVAPEIYRFEEKGIKVLVSSPESLRVANNKRRLYEMFRNDSQVKVPEFLIANSLENFIAGCKELGYPRRNLCFKPPLSKGSRGFRFLNANISRSDLLMNYKPDSKIISLGEIIEIFKGQDSFPELIIMEAVEGEEIDTMVLAYKGDPLLITHKTREADRGGVITRGMHVDRPEINKSVQAILNKVPLSFNIGIQFKGGYLIEINPRLSTFLYTADWVEPYFAIKLALGEYTKDDVRALQKQVPEDLRMIRYFDQFFFNK